MKELIAFIFGVFLTAAAKRVASKVKKQQRKKHTAYIRYILPERFKNHEDKKKHPSKA